MVLASFDPAAHRRYSPIVCLLFTPFPFALRMVGGMPFDDVAAMSLRESSWAL